tara:strand:+ start:17815 stop:17967 length:153 start_codon:yes stop_codon:yes gene_type:complete
MIGRAQSEMKEVKLVARVIRANGQVEELGTIAHHKKKSLIEKIRGLFNNK